MSRLFVIQVAGLSNRKMMKRKRREWSEDISLRCHQGGVKHIQLVLCLQIILQTSFSKELGVANLHREKAERSVMHPMFSQVSCRWEKQLFLTRQWCASREKAARVRLNPIHL